MKKILALLIIITILLPSCQKTPEQEIVKNKNRELFEDLSREPAKDPYIVPERLTESLEGKDGITRFSIDAGIDFPREQKIPVVEIVPKEIDIALVKKMAEVFMPGLVLYEPLSIQATKSEIEDYIIQTYGQIALSGDRKETENESSYLLDALKELLETAPEEKKLVQAQMEFRPSKDYELQYIYMANMYEFSEEENKDSFVQELLDKYENKQQIMLQAFFGSETSGLINAYNYSSQVISESGIHFYRQTISEALAALAPEDSMKLASSDGFESVSDVDTEEADIAMRSLESMGLGDWEITDIECSPKLTVIIFQPQYNGIQTDDAIADIYGEDYEKMTEVMESAVNPFYKKENIEVKIADKQIISFKWENPSETSVEINDNAALMEFNEIAGIIKTQLPIICNVNQYDDIYVSGDNAVYGRESITGIDFSISEIKLRMVRIAVKNKRGTYNMVPAWICTGSETITLKKSKDEMVSTTNEDVDFLTVNAIDGTIIDIKLGY